MGWPLVLMAASTVISAAGALQADRDQADAERANGDYYGEQAAFIQESTEREVLNFNEKAEKSLANTVGALSEGNGAIGGSSLSLLAFERSKADSERAAIEREGAFRKRLALLRQRQAYDTADDLTSPQRQFGTVLGAVANFGAAAYGKG